MCVYTGFPTGVENVPLGALQVSIGGGGRGGFSKFDGGGGGGLSQQMREA